MLDVEWLQPVSVHVRRLWSFALIAVLGTVTFGWMCDAIGDRDGVTVIDAPVSTWFADHRSTSVGDWGLLLARLTSPTFILIAVAAATVVLIRRGRRIEAGLLASATALAYGAGLISKYAEHRARPSFPVNLAPESEPSFPSGHLLVIATIAVVAVGLAWPHLTRVSRVLIVIAAASVTALIAVDRLVVGAHWLTDVIGSLALASVIASLVLASSRFLRSTG